MIQHDISLRQTAPLCKCGERCRVIESRGRSITDPRLLGTPSSTYHVECMECGIASVPQHSVGVALHAWKTGNTVDTAKLPMVRGAIDMAQIKLRAVA
ncbi:MAG: hypothetical protein JSR63_07975 [Proteobacteria bacterium]|nr:hypothetical protein [Pseudomonadota bacterium]